MDEDNPDVLTLNPKAKKLATTVFEFNLSSNDVQFGADTSSYGENCAAVIKEGINQGVRITANKLLADFRDAVT